MSTAIGNSDVRSALALCKSSFIAVGVFSLFVNLLMLTPAFYMLQVYDRVLSSGSYSTLLMLTLIMTFLLLTLGGLEWVRGQMLVRIGTRLESLLDNRLFDASFNQAISISGAKASSQALSDLTGLRQFISGNGLFAFFDAPWLPVYILVMYLFHPLFGLVGLLAAGLLLMIALLNQKLIRIPQAEANSTAVVASEFVVRNLRNAEVIKSMGMLGNIRQHWQDKHRQSLVLQAKTNSMTGASSSISRVLRLTVQSLILGLGAYLVLEQEISPGLMIAGSILLGRALAPVDMMIGSWRQFSLARIQLQRINSFLESMPQDEERMSLPPPKGEVRAEAVSIAPPGSRSIILKNVSFIIPCGEIVGLIGPSASGKTTLARGILGIWPALAGTIRLDGASVCDLNRDELGPHLGYLPQDIELFDGSVGENISRFGEMNADAVVRAAKQAGAHNMILRLPQGYDTQSGTSGSGLSAGQRQRIALARALYGSPSLIVLDEPNSNLDEEGENALVGCLNQLKRQGSTVLVISHRKSIVAGVDNLMVIKEGRLVLYGPKQDVLRKMNDSVASIRAKQGKLEP